MPAAGTCVDVRVGRHRFPFGADPPIARPVGVKQLCRPGREVSMVIRLRVRAGLCANAHSNGANANPARCALRNDIAARLHHDDLVAERGVRRTRFTGVS